MYNIAIIYMGESYEQHLNTIKLQELLGKITVIGISDQNFDNAQYFTNKLLETAITATMLI